MEDLAGLQHVAARDRAAVGVRDQVVVALAERVVHFGEHGAHGAVAVVRDPEAHRVEHVAQHAGHRVQHDLAVGGDALAREQVADPGQERRTVPRAVVAVVERHEAARVPRDAARGQLLQPRERQAQAESGVAERVDGGPRAPMPDLAGEDREAVRTQRVQRFERGGREAGVHGSDLAIRRRRARARRRSAPGPRPHRRWRRRPRAPSESRPRGTRGPATRRRTRCCAVPA